MLPSFARTWVLLLLGSLFALGCPPEDGSLPPTLPGVDPSAGESLPVQAAEPPTPSATGVEPPTPLVTTKQTVRVCLMLPASGPSKDVGAEMRRGVGIAQAEIAKDKDAARIFEWTEKDTKSTEPGAVSAFKACFNEGHHVIIGPVHPAGTTALIPVAASHEVVLMIPELGAAVPSVWSENLFAIAPPATEMGRIAGTNARGERGFLKGAVLHVPGVFGTGLRDAFETSFLSGEEGASIVMKKELPPDKPEAWGRAAEEAKAAGAEAIFVVGPPDPSRAVALTLADDAGKAHVWFVDWSMHPPVLEAAGVAGRSRVHWLNRALPRGGFEAEYVARFQARPEYPAGAGYDAVKVSAMAAVSAPSTWHEDISATIKAATNLPSAFGTGAMVEVDGLTYEDVAGYQLIEPVRLSNSDVWVFGGFQ